MADTEDLCNLSASAGNSDVDGVKVGETLTGHLLMMPMATPS